MGRDESRGDWRGRVDGIGSLRESSWLGSGQLSVVLHNRGRKHFYSTMSVAGLESWVGTLLLHIP